MAAVSGTAFAQSTVTLSGKLRYAYESTTSNAAGVATKANGLRVTDGDFVLSATEDLGGGLKASANMAVQSRGRDTAIAGRDATMSLSGGFGSIMIGSIDAANGIIGLGGAGASVYGMDGSVIAGGSNVDILQYTSPSISGFTFSVNTTDATQVTGQQATATTTDGITFGVRYFAGPLAVAADATNSGANAYVPTGAAQVDAGVPDSRTRFSASYDLGVAKIGAGFQTATNAANVKTKDMIVGLNVPMGALSLGLNYATSQRDGLVKVKGFDLGAKYDLSKRTFVAFHYQDVDNRNTTGASTGAQIGATNDNSKYRIQLAHSF